MLDLYSVNDPATNAFNAEQAWLRGVLNDGCEMQEGCPDGGPAMHHLSFGPDGISLNVFEVCKDCVLRTRCQLGQTAWIVARGEAPDLSPTPVLQPELCTIDDAYEPFAASTLDFDDSPKPVPALDPKYLIMPMHQTPPYVTSKVA